MAFYEIGRGKYYTFIQEHLAIGLHIPLFLPDGTVEASQSAPLIK
jgi:hypothetical protein